MKASARAAVASAPLYSKFAASQRLDAAAARAARLAQRRGMPEAAASASGDGMVTPPACSRAGSLTEHDSPAMSTASPNGMDSSPQPASSVAASATSSPSRAPANAVAARRTAKAIVERRIRERAAAVSAASSHAADSGENRREVKNQLPITEGKRKRKKEKRKEKKRLAPKGLPPPAGAEAVSTAEGRSAEPPSGLGRPWSTPAKWVKCLSLDLEPPCGSACYHL